MRLKPISENQITLSVNQAAEVLGVERSTIIRLVNAGKLPQVKLTDTRVGILRTDLNKYVKQRREFKTPCNKAIDVAKSPRVKAATTANTQS